MSAGLLRLLLPALLVVGGAAAGLAQTMPNRASEYAAGARPWLRCGIEQALDVDFEGNDRPYRVEWRRCGPRRAEWSPDGKITYPSHYVVVTLNRASPTPLVVFDNADEPGTSHIESVRPARFTRDRQQQLVVVAGLYGTGAAWELCALGLVNDRLACWDLPGWGPAIAPLMAADEESWKSLLRVVTSRGSIFVELRPGNGRFEIGRIWRVPPRKEPR